MTAPARQAPGVVKVRLSGEPAGLEHLLIEGAHQGIGGRLGLDRHPVAFPDLGGVLDEETGELRNTRVGHDSRILWVEGSETGGL